MEWQRIPLRPVCHSERVSTPSDDARLHELSGQEVRAVLADILRDLDVFCSESAISYYLYAGTLLGAARHQGFIPWDDDIDVMMSRNDFERFCATFAPRGDLELVTRRERPSYPYASAKVARRDTLVVEEVDIDPRERFGIAVDVLPFDTVSDNRWLFKVHVWLAWMVRGVLLLKIVQPTHNRPRATRVMLVITRTLLRPISVSALTGARERIAMLWRSRDTQHVSMLIASVPWRVRRNLIEPGGEIVFEGRSFPAPSDPHGLLAAVYGPDYMTPPPGAMDRPPHLAVAYRKAPGF